MRRKVGEARFDKPEPSLTGSANPPPDILPVVPGQIISNSVSSLIPAPIPPQADLDLVSEYSRARLISLTPEALVQIESKLKTSDPETQLEIAWRILDEAQVSPKARSRPGGSQGSLEGESSPALIQALGAALEGLGRGLGEAVRGRGVSSPAPQPEAELAQAEVRFDSGPASPNPARPRVPRMRKES